MQIQSPELLFSNEKLFVLSNKEQKVDNSTTIKGFNGKGYVFLVNNPVELPAEEQEQFDRILPALKLTMEDIALINVAQIPNFSAKWLVENVVVNKLTLFGAELLTYFPNIQPAKYHVYKQHGFDLLLSDNLKVIRGRDIKVATPEKIKLVTAFGRLFNISFGK